MKILKLLVFFLLISFGYAEETKIEKHPYVEYHNRMVVFNLSYLAYERIKPKSLYAGLEGGATFPLVGKNRNNNIYDGEFRLGYNFFWQGREHFTPWIGVGYFQDTKKHHYHYHSVHKPGVSYAALGFRYDHEFNSIFNLGLNLNGLIGGPVSSKHFDWGCPVGGLEASIPITFRFGNKRHWDVRLEPFDLCLIGTKETENYLGLRSALAYRF